MMNWRRVWMVAGCLVVVGAVYSGLRPLPADVALLKFLKTEYPRAKEVTLYSLDPEARWERPNEDAQKREQFWDCDVLGKVRLMDSKEREHARAGVREAVESGNQDAHSACIFEPRHALRITTESDKLVTIALCYKCGQLKFTGIPGQYSECSIGGCGMGRLSALQSEHKLLRNIPKDRDA
jgi:hypothetical protein